MWLSEGAHGDMDWMVANAPRRAKPRELWPDVRAIVMLGMNYGPESDPLAAIDDKSAGNISVYARHRDYHDLIKGKLKQLASWLLSEAKRGGVPDADVKVFVDTAPVMEKPLAAAAGIGWQGKHTNLVSREFGSWLFLGAIFTDARPRCRAAGRGSLRHLPRLSRYLPDASFPRTLSARCAALHLLSDDRASRSDSARVPSGHRQSHLWLRRLPRGLSVEQIRRNCA